MSENSMFNEKIVLKIGNIVELNFDKLNDAEKFAYGYNQGIKMKDFDYNTFDCEMEQRGFDFSFKVWSMLRLHKEEETEFKKNKAYIPSSPRRLKSHIANKVFP